MGRARVGQKGANMRINVARELSNVDGTPRLIIGDACPMCRQPIAGQPRTATLRYLCVEALSATYPDEVDQRGRTALTGEDKVRRWNLALQIQQHDEPDLSVDDLALLKRLIAKQYGPVEVGQAWVWLDPESED
jgi:hypothetical protein